MKNFTFGGAKFFLGVQRGAESPDIEKSLHRTVVSTHSQNFSILAELEMFNNRGLLGGVLDPSRVGGGPDFKNLRKPYTEWWSEPKLRISAL